MTRRPVAATLQQRFELALHTDELLTRLNELGAEQVRRMSALRMAGVADVDDASDLGQGQPAPWAERSSAILTGGGLEA